MKSILLAPEQIGLLAEAPMAVSAAQNRLLDARAQAPGGTAGKVAIYGGYEFGKADIDTTGATIGTRGDVSGFNIGGDAQVSSALRAGALFGYSENKADFGGNTGGFKIRETMLTAYAAYNPGAWYIGGSFGAGDLKFRNIHRDIELGSAIRSENSSTKGNHIVARAVGGLNFGSQSFSHGPVASLTYQQIKVNGFSEDGANSTTMIFTEQTRKSLISSLGYQLSAQIGGAVALTPWLRVAWENEHNDNDRDVRAALVTMGGSFGLPAYKVDDNYGKVDVGLGAQFSPSLTGYINYNTTFAQSNQKTNAVTIGLKLAM